MTKAFQCDICDNYYTNESQREYMIVQQSTYIGLDLCDKCNTKLLKILHLRIGKQILKELVKPHKVLEKQEIKPVLAKKPQKQPKSSIKELKLNKPNSLKPKKVLTDGRATRMQWVAIKSAELIESGLTRKEAMSTASAEYTKMKSKLYAQRKKDKLHSQDHLQPKRDAYMNKMREELKPQTKALDKCMYCGKEIFAGDELCDDCKDKLNEYNKKPNMCNIVTG